MELIRRTVDAFNRRDFDTVMSFYRRDCVWDASPWGIGTFEGTAAVRRFFEEWIGAYEEFAIEPEEIVDLGNGVIFSVFCHDARPTGSTGHVRAATGRGLRVGEGRDCASDQLSRHR